MSGNATFSKMVGAGNDFIVVDNRAKKLGRLSALSRRLADRKRAIGADGLILLEGSKKAAVRMRIFNPDGSEAEMCGNGVRCLAKFAADRHIAGKRFTIETLAGLVGAEVKGRVVKVKMADVHSIRRNIRLSVGGKSVVCDFINTGVPHAVIFSPNVKKAPLETLGPKVRNHRHFAPKGTNVNFVEKKTGNTIAVRTFERGVEDETLACGTGSTASALLAALHYGLKSPVRVKTHGGETLRILFTKKGTGFTDVYLEGPVTTSFEGRIQI